MEKQNFIVFFRGSTQKAKKVFGTAISVDFPNRENFCRKIEEEHNILNVTITNILRVSAEEVEFFCATK
jgi:hypothetical protein